MNFARKAIYLLLALTLALAVVSCQGEQPAPQEVTFAATEYAYQGPESINGGWTQLTLDNQGQLPHDLIAVHLSGERSADDIQQSLLAGDPPPAWVEVAGSVRAEPGQSASFFSDLEPGDYALFSFANSIEGPPDFAQGMIDDLTVTPPEKSVGEEALPEPQASIELTDFAFDISGLRAGEQLVRVSNTGSEMHEATIYRMQEGKTLEDFQAFVQAELSGEPRVGEPPMEEAGAVFLSPGKVTYTTLDLNPGNHIFVCFVPSEANGMQPHLELGMISQVTIAPGLAAVSPSASIPEEPLFSALDPATGEVDMAVEAADGAAPP